MIGVGVFTKLFYAVAFRSEGGELYGGVWRRESDKCKGVSVYGL